MRARASLISMLVALAFVVASATALATDEYALGNQQYLLGNYGTAKAHFTKAIAADPRSWEAHYQLANTCMQLKDFVQAKKSYARCLTCNPFPDIKANCERALQYLTSPPAPIALPATRTPANPPVNLGPEESSSFTPSEPHLTDAEIQKQNNRARIMREAEVEVEKMRAEETLRWKEMVSQSNRVFRYSDGSYKRGLSQEDTDQFVKEVEQKAKAIRDRAKRNVESIR